MSFLENAKDKISDAADKVKDETWAQEEKAEDDTEADSAVAGSRAKRDDEDGTYVGRTNPQFDSETQESGAEARAEADGQ
ncbi:hypothetical protein [Mycolicibacterium sediminis]|uniref:Uncharacterized protein n=1 Tax=Mycolicibacterium sediminis TaxID=1286180 RepID=A0A7I7QKF6_9MYCO|nr:hypothetical protein [Mycolicibacterium sediminis]BBY26853.1 hypothetical protein MSEDJ_09490 [Mycolicibacterium sediminis]